MRKILISRTDNIGDVVLTLPLAGIIKKNLPDTTVAFLGTDYSEAVIRKSKHVDEFHNWSLLQKNLGQSLKDIDATTIVMVYPDKNIVKAAYQAQIPQRIGAYNRLSTLLYCTQKVWLPRSRSTAHEAQLNIQLLAPLGIETKFELDEIPQYYGWKETNKLTLSKKFNVIFHPKSYGHGCEWLLQRYFDLAQLLDPDKFCIYITGSKEEGESIARECRQIFELPHVHNVTGQYTLAEFIHFIESADCLVASGTGPIHIAAAAGILAIGLYPASRPIDPSRWGPVGKKAIAISKGDLTNHKKNMHQQMNNISSEEIYRVITDSLVKSNALK